MAADGNPKWSHIVIVLESILNINFSLLAMVYTAGSFEELKKTPTYLQMTRSAASKRVIK